MTIGVYSITNNKDGKRYIGSSIDIKQRWSTHASQLRCGKHYNRQRVQLFGYR